MPAFIPTIPQAFNDLGLLGPVYEQTIQVRDAALRSLNSEPVVVIAAPGPNKLIMPGAVGVQIITAGTVAFSGAISGRLVIPLSGDVLDVSLPAVISGSVSEVIAIEQWFPSGGDYVSNSGVNAPVVLISGGDVTGGDGTVLTLILTYLVIDVGGLI
jgi:hypothetical protein